MRNGEKIEKFVRFIHESLKNVPDTEILSNYRIDNNSGRKREIDILIKSVINGIEIAIAVECKDYKRRVSAEKIEAFNSKCDRINGISKKVFVATNGYQADAINAANEFEIDLFDLNEIDKKSIIDWFPIKQLKTHYRLKMPFNIKVISNEEEIPKLPLDKELVIYFYDGSDPMQLSVFLWNNIVFKNQRMLKSLMIYDFLKYGNLNYQTIFPFALDLNGIYIMENKKNHKITRIESSVIGWMEEVPANIIEGRSYKKINEAPQAGLISLDVEKKEKADVVFTKDMDIKIFHTDSMGNVKQMKTLFEYNSKTDKLKRINDNE